MGAATGTAARLAVRMRGAREGWPNTSAQLVSPQLASALASRCLAWFRVASPDQTAGIGSAMSWEAGFTAMAIGLLSTSAWAPPARASQPARSTAMPVRTVRVDVACVVAMGRTGSKAQASNKILFILVF